MSQKEKSSQKQEVRICRVCDGKLEGDLKVSGTGVTEAYNYHLGERAHDTGQTRGYTGEGHIRV